ncbi:MAG: PEP-CTERM sorting domain-containing protein [Phycisphaeraceae bacterium]
MEICRTTSPLTVFCRILAAAVPLLCLRPATATVLGLDDFGHVLIVDNLVSGSDDHIDSYSTYTQPPANSGSSNNRIALPGSSSIAVASITESNQPGIAYALATDGTVYRVDWYNQSASVIANLAAPAVGTGSSHTLFDSITNVAGTDDLFILRNGAGVDFIDSLNPNNGTHTHNVFTTTATGSISISEGPEYSTTNGATTAPFAVGSGPALYLVATAGNFEAYDLTSPGSSASVISAGTAGLDAGNLVSLTDLPGDSGGLFIIQDRTGAITQDSVHRFLLDGTREVNKFTVVHTGASTITDAHNSTLYTEATGGAFGVIDVPGNTVFDGGAQTFTSHQSAASIPGTPSPSDYIYIADDRTANHLDLFDTHYSWTAGSYSNALSNAATTTGAAGTDFQDSSITDGPGGPFGSLYQIHTDGQLFRIDPATGAAAMLVDLDAPGTSSNRSTFDSITNLPGSNKLYILRTDRPLTAATGGTLVDFIDEYDLLTGVFTPEIFTTVGGGTLAITDGPGGKLYTIASGGNLEEHDLNTLLTTVLRAGRAPGDSTGDFIDITNIEGDMLNLYVLRDRKAGDGTDRIDVFDIFGGETFEAFGALIGTGGYSLTDMNDGRLFTQATGGAMNLIDPRTGTINGFSTGNQTFAASVTNLPGVPEPMTLGLMGLGAVALLRRRQRV